MKISLFLAITFFTACSNKVPTRGKVLIIKQWHPSAGLDTTNIRASTQTPQYQNQKEIYDYLSKKIESKKHSFLIAEGCESGKAIDENFHPTFNGWSMSSLSEALKHEDYDDIVTSLPMKLKTKYPREVTALCGDSEDLLIKNQIAISDARGFFGFYLRLKQSMSDSKKFALYKNALEETQKAKIDNPIDYTKAKAMKSLEEFNFYIKQRNAHFAQMIKTNIHKNPVLIIGGLHAEDLIIQLENLGIEKEVMVFKSYPESSEKLTENLIYELMK